METPAAFCCFWSLALGLAHIQKSLLNWKLWKRQMEDSSAQGQLFMVLLVLRSPHSQEGHGPTSGSITFCAMPPEQTALAKVTQSRVKSSLKYVLQLQRHQLSLCLNCLWACCHHCLLSLPPAPCGMLWLEERGGMNMKRVWEDGRVWADPGDWFGPEEMVVVWSGSCGAAQGIYAWCREPGLETSPVL